MNTVETKQIQKPKRQSNFELLRIVAMLLIVAHHFVLHSGFDFGFDVFTTNRLWLKFIEFGGKVGVNLFILISGYFSVKSTNLKISKVVKLALQVFGYSVLIYLLFVLFGVYPFSWSEMHKMAFPLINGHWWFASAYFIVYILSPFFNRFLLTLDKQTYRNFLLIGFVIWSIIPTLFDSMFQSNDLVWLFYAYALGGYIKLWSKTDKSAKHYLGISALLIGLVFGAAVLLQYLSIYNGFWHKYYYSIYRGQNIPFFFISLYMFLGFKNLNIGYVKWINIISATTFGVYLIHEHSYARPYLWYTLLNNASRINDEGFILYSIVVIFAVFAICSAIEWIRINLLEKWYMKYADKLSLKLEDKLSKLSQKEYIEKL